MDKERARTENRYLLIAAIGAAAIGCFGLVFSFIASSEAILLDGMFNLVYSITGLFTLKVARLVQRGDDDTFPFGYAAFEPLVNGLKGLLMLGFIVMATIDAIESLFAGGRVVEPGPGVIYGVVGATACWALALVARRAGKHTGSPLIHADALNWLVNGVITTGVLLAFVGIIAIRGTELEFVSPYVDPVLVLLVSLISVFVPIRMAWRALMELLARAPSPDIIAKVRKTIEACTADLPVREIFLRVIQPGRTRMVQVYVVLPEDYPVGSLTPLDAIQAKVMSQLQDDHPDTIVDMIFTANAKFGAPAGQP